VTHRFAHYFMKDGLPNNTIFSILEDSRHRLWISTGQGLSRFDPVTGVFRNFSTNDGLQSEEFKPHAALYAGTGLLYFGGVNGFNQFLPDFNNTVIIFANGVNSYKGDEKIIVS